MKKRCLWMGLLTGLLLLTACDKAENEYSSSACRFAFYRFDETLATAVNEHSRGVFCLISETTRSGATYLVFESNQNMRSEKLETKEEQEAEFILGRNNGIIVGFQNLNEGFTAYDRQCPNCVRNANYPLAPKFPLSMSSSGIATCGKCQKRYDMNNNGIIQNGEKGDVNLTKYVAATSGPSGYVTVHSR